MKKVDAIVVWLLITLGMFAGCYQEKREYREVPPAAVPDNSPASTEFRPGPKSSTDSQTAAPHTYMPYEKNAYSLSEGKRLFNVFNCSGCHANGGGGMGPPLMDDKWRYGSAPNDIYTTIVAGRPNGMPSFRGRIPEQQVWQLVAFVRALGGLSSAGPSPGRDDDMSIRPPENTLPRQMPKPEVVPSPEPRS